ncbi:beta-klotho [Ascaphus truei]|uniref:beta-klotho n=1 Tax=Ascaphus truei TaxID=8439 RepID=UPI003F5903E8
MSELWLKGSWLFVALVFIREVTGSPGEGRRVWERNHLLNPLNESQLFTYGTFPQGFLWGVGSSSLQVEEEDNSTRGPSTWDQFMRSHQTWVANSSHHQQPRDTPSSSPHKLLLPALEFLGVHFYYFSISWPRLFPGGVSQIPSEKGVKYYNSLIDLLISRHLQPVITLYHWDLPVSIQEKYGGWANESVTHLFNNYARFCFQEFGDRVKYWITMHNPYLIAWHGYGTGVHAPWQTGDEAQVSAVAHNLIKAHAMVWHTYNTHFRQSQKGYLSVTLGSHWIEPEKGNTNPITIEMCQMSLDTVLGRFAKPIHGDGDYPEILKGKHSSVLPNFTETEKTYIKGTADFFAFSFGPNNFKSPYNATMLGRVSIHLRGLLNWIKLEYDSPRIMIMENGWYSNSHVKTEDTTAIYIMKKFINEVLQAIKHDDINVFGYTAWSLADGFEWQEGYKIRRGLFYVDFNSTEKELIPKSSAFYYKQVIQHNGFPVKESASSTHGQFPCDFNWGVTDSILKAELMPSSPQFTDRRLYVWNSTGNGDLHAVKGVKLKTRPAQCTDFISIKKQLALLTRMKVTHYRFALNWSLILPKGDLSTINREVLRYYRCMVDEASNLNIKTMVTLYYPTHTSLSLPGPLVENGGWLNRTITQAFHDYATLCFQELGELVKQWITINEPNRLNHYYDSSSNNTYQAVHNVLIAHAMAWQTYDKKYRSVQHGYVSLALRTDWAEPANIFLKSHAEAADRLLQFDIAWLAEPLFGSGDYPVHMREYILAKNQRGLSSSFFPNFTEEERSLVRGAADFFALNHFTTRLVIHEPKNGSRYDSDRDIHTLSDATCLSSAGGVAVVPSGIRKVLQWIKRNYGDIPIYITANGIDDKSSSYDDLRIYYLQQYNRQVLQAYQEDKINVKGYYAFKLTDKTKPQYGFFNSPFYNLKAKYSVDVYSALISLNGFPLDPSDNICRVASDENQCPLCVFLEQKKPLVFFCFCLFSTSVLLLTVTVIRKYKKKRRKLCTKKHEHTVCFLFKKNGSFSLY